MTASDGYMEDARGRLVPAGSVRAEALLEDDVVRKLAREAERISERLEIFKSHAFSEVDTFRDVLAEKYRTTKGGTKGNMTLTSFDGRIQVQVQIAEYIAFGAELDAARELINECIADWSEGASDKLRVLVDDAFQVNKAGKIDTQRVLALRKFEFDDDRWLRAMDAIADAIRVTSRKPYIRFYRVNPETGDRQAISLDIARF